MARAAAKRKPAPRHDDAYKRKHKDSGGQRYEDQLFFNRLRKQAKWVFVLLILAFGLGFVLFGVGSSNLGGLSDVFNGIRGGGSGTPSVDKPLKRTQENPKDAQAWNDLATAYDLRGDYKAAIPAWEAYIRLRPKDADALQRLATDYEQQFSTQTNEAAIAQAQAQEAQPTSFGPPSDSPLGRALASQTDPIGSAISQEANIRFNQAYSERQATAGQLVGVYQKLAKLQPTESGVQFQLAQAAENAGNTAVAITAYRQFVKLAPDDLNAPQAKARLQALQAQATASSSGSAG
jgi:tetratricopeptide (TPR) repeat protein